MRLASPPSFTSYIVAAISVALALALRWSLTPWLGDHFPFITLFAAVAIAVWAGGAVPGILGTVLGYVGSYFLFIRPINPAELPWGEHLVGLAAYLVSCAIIITFGEAMRGARQESRDQRELLRLTLSSIGDAVIATDATGVVTYLNGVAESLTGWPQAEAVGRPLTDVLYIIDELRRNVVDNPALRALREGTVVGLANHTVLIDRSGIERPIDDSAAPIRDSAGQLVGAVLVFRDVSARRAADRALARSEQELRDLFDNATIGLHSVGPDGIILRVNQAELDMLGYRRDEYVGRPIADFYADPTTISEVLARLTAGESIDNYSARLRCKDGSIKDVLISSNALWEDGRFIYSRCFTRDVTEITRGFEAQARLAAIVEASDDAIVSKSLDGTIQTWNAGAERVFGYTAAEAVGRSISLIIPPDRLFEEDTILGKIRRGERVEPFETIRLTRSGRLIDVSLSISPVRNAAGQVIGASKVARDISARKRAEEALAAAERQLRIVTNSAPVLLANCDASARYKFVNEPYAARFGLRADEIVGRNISDVLGTETYSAIAPHLATVLSGQAVEFDAELAYDHGDPQHVHCAYTPERDASGAVVGLVAVIIDITERKRVEHQLQEADRRKDQFLAILAHELRNPLAPIRNSLEAMKLAGDDPAVVAAARDTMDRQLAVMQRLIDDLLDVSRITRDRLDLRLQPVELTTVLHQAVEASRPLGDSRGHTLSLDAPSEPIGLDGDPVRLAQVFSNLLNNAFKYTPRGGQVWLSARREGDQAVVTIRDTGVGIPADMLPRVFDMFTQVDQSIERSQGGLGIGLTLVKRIIEMHGGQVEARSAGPDRGTSMVVTLPCAAAPPALVLPQASGNERVTIAARRVLVVDDLVDGAESVAMLLTLAGHQTRTAHDGLAAIEVARDFRPDLVLLDIGLPKLNGYETCRRIRQEEWGRDLALVALSGWGQVDDRRKSKDAGFDAHLVKPIDPEFLLKMVSSLAPSSGQPRLSFDGFPDTPGM